MLLRRVKIKMEDKVFTNSVCLTEKQIINYKANNLSNEELREIEKHLIDCPLCSDAIDGAENINPESIQNDITFVKKRIENHTKKRISKVFVYSAVAALLLITATVIFNVSRPSNAEKMFNEYFEVYPDVTVHKRGTGSETKLAFAMNYYNRKQYRKAAKLYTKIIELSNNETAIFYKGISLMALNHMNNALKDFLKISNNTKNNFYAEANWYAALSLINMNKTDEAKTYLSKLNNSSDYREKAKKILKQLSKAD